MLVKGIQFIYTEEDLAFSFLLLFNYNQETYIAELFWSKISDWSQKLLWEVSEEL